MSIIIKIQNRILPELQQYSDLQRYQGEMKQKHLSQDFNFFKKTNSQDAIETMSIIKENNPTEENEETPNNQGTILNYLI